MRLVIQRVKKASVSIESNIVGKIGKGYVVLLGIKNTDTYKDADYLVRKLNSEIAKQDSNTLNHVELSSMHNSSLKVGGMSEFREKLKDYSINEVKELIEIIEKGSLYGAFFGKYDLIHNIIFNHLILNFIYFT